MVAVYANIHQNVRGYTSKLNTKWWPVIWKSNNYLHALCLTRGGMSWDELWCLFKVRLDTSICMCFPCLNIKKVILSWSIPLYFYANITNGNSIQISAKTSFRMSVRRTFLKMKRCMSLFKHLFLFLFIYFRSGGQLPFWYFLISGCSRFWLLTNHSPYPLSFYFEKCDFI